MHLPDHGGGPIPASLHSAQHERPFTTCQVCSRALDAATSYTIVKSYRRDECVFEMAICTGCAEAEAETYSEASKAALHAFRRRMLEHLEGDGCDTCGSDLDPVRGVSVYGRCRGDELWLVSHMCATCEEALNDALSPETRGEHDRFMQTHFPGPPGMEQPLETASEETGLVWAAGPLAGP